MSSLTALPENPYFTLANDTLTVHCHKKTLRFGVADIQKMFIRKNSNYWHQLVGHLLSAPSNVYDLHIVTTEVGFVLPSIRLNAIISSNSFPACVWKERGA
jgi:hypothetical protein